MQISEGLFGPTKEYTLHNDVSGEYVKIVPELGAIVRLLRLRKADKNYTIINCGDSYEAWLADKSFPSTLLFPWPSRLRDGQYEFEGKKYSYPINEAGLNNALHGFVSHKPFELVSQHADAEKAEITLAYNYAAEQAGYPFSFRLVVEYCLDANGLQLRFEVENTGKSNMPMGIGWHPYFEIEGREAKDLQLIMPAEKQYMLDNQMIPVGHGLYAYNNGVNDLANKNYDSIFKIAKGQSIAKTCLTSAAEDLTIEVWQQAEEKQFNYVVIYMPPNGRQVAIEPMTCNGNAFNNHEGLLQLAAGEKYAVSCGVKLC